MCDDVYHTDHGFITPPEHIPSEDDMRRYSLGDELVIPVLIEGITGYIVTAVTWFIRHTPTAKPFQEDCISEALLALTVFTNRELGKEYTPAKFLAWASTDALNKVKDWLREMSIAITIPATSQRNKGSLSKQKLDDGMRSTSKDSILTEACLKEFLDDLDYFDLVIVQMKMGGESNRYISDELGVSHATIRMHLDRLADVFEGIK